MKFLPLLGKQLKDDDVTDLLECDDVEVIYDFDRLHENTADVYWAAAKEQGYLLRFDAQQVLDVIFLYVVPAEGFAPINQNLVDDVVFFASRSELEAHVHTCNLRATRGAPSPDRAWIRVELGRESVHYEYIGGQLTLVTLALKK